MAVVSGEGGPRQQVVRGGRVVKPKPKAPPKPLPRNTAPNRGGSTYRRKPIAGGGSTGASSGGQVTSGDIDAIIKAGLAQRGVPYSWGGGNYNGKTRGIEHGAKTVGFDCSGLMEYIFAQAGVKLPSVAREQAKKGVGINQKDIRPGDMVFFDRSSDRPGIDHVALYLGNGKILEAPRTGLTVRVASVDLSKATSIRRVVNGTSSEPSSAGNTKGELARLISAIGEQESNNNYRAKGQVNRNGDRAYGRFQIMGNNIPSWTREVLGKSMTPQEFLNDNQAQFRVAEAKLRYYYKKYGAAGAAAAWYGGEGGAKKYIAGGNVNARNGPKLRTYVKEVMARVGNSTVGAPGFGDSPAANIDDDFDWDETTSTADKRRDLETAFAAAGYPAALINSSPELKKIFQEGIAGGWTDTLFVQKIKDSKWFQSRSDKQREFDTIKLTDPKTWNDNIHDQKEAIRTAALAMGVSLSDGRMETLAKTSLRNGFTDGELSRAIAAEFNYDPKKVYKGAAGSTITEIQNTAYAYGVKPTTKHVGDQVKSILGGANTLEGLKGEYINQAKSKWSHLATELDAGKTVEQIANPYIESMAQTLELNAEQVDLFDQTVQKGLAKKDPKTGAASTMALWEYEESLRNDDRWLKTNNARESVLGVGRSLLSSMGLVT